MHNEILQAIPATLYLPQFGLDFPVMRMAGMGDYFPVRAFCKRIGLASQPQLERLQSDASYAGGLETFTVPTAGGPQDALCIRKKELAWWIASLEPRTCASWRNALVFPSVNSNRRSWTLRIVCGGALQIHHRLERRMGPSQQAHSSSIADAAGQGIGLNCRVMPSCGRLTRNKAG